VEHPRLDPTCSQPNSKLAIVKYVRERSIYYSHAIVQAKPPIFSSRIGKLLRERLQVLYEFMPNFAYTSSKDTALDDGLTAVASSSKQDRAKVMLSGIDNKPTYGAEIPFQTE
jgi:hypothetical protein